MAPLARPSLIGGLLLAALAAVGCKQGVGDRCEQNSDCSSGICNNGNGAGSNGICADSTTGTGTGGSGGGAGAGGSGGTSDGAAGSSGDAADAPGAGGASGAGGSSATDGAADVPTITEAGAVD
jgi:hypothetical protein